MSWIVSFGDPRIKASELGKWEKSRNFSQVLEYPFPKEDTDAPRVPRVRFDEARFQVRISRTRFFFSSSEWSSNRVIVDHGGRLRCYNAQFQNILRILGSLASNNVCPLLGVATAEL